jgi:hypothetical protein
MAVSIIEDPENSSLGHESEYPDGGWRAWSVVLGSWCAMVPSFGLLNTIGVLEAWLARDPAAAPRLAS